MLPDSTPSTQSLSDRIKHPRATFRGIPFWAWNAKLEPQELRRQIRIFKQMGMGGFFMHSRTGLATPYLSDEWFECIRACINEAEKNEMQAWLYDEDRWPSGAAGGLATEHFPEFRARVITWQSLNTTTDYAKISPDAILAHFAVVNLDGKAISRYRRINSADDSLSDDESCITFFTQEMPPTSRYNGGTYLDTLNPKAVQKFIEVTHEAYYKKVGEDFGAKVPGIFTDEPNFSSPTPWTPALPEAFKTAHGYDFRNHLPELFFLCNNAPFSKVRLDFKETLAQLFTQAYSKTIGDWCRAHNLKFTGHVRDEDTLCSQSHIVGDPMRFYEFMDIPGIDLLTEYNQCYRLAKQCSSIGHQLGKPQRITELYGSTGWDFPFEGYKAIGDWQMALGINLRAQHLAWYSMQGPRKRDFPGSISFQSPWASIHHEIDDYFAHIGEALASGEEVRHILVLHPVESVWGFQGNGFTHETARTLDREFATVSYTLLGANLDFDYGSEEIIARHACVNRNCVQVHHANYKTIVIPPMYTIRATTLTLLEQFAKNGGHVFYVGTPPSCVDGIKNTHATEIFKTFTHATVGTLPQSIAPFARTLSITEKGVETEATLYSLKKNPDALTLFVCNTSAPMPTAQNEQDFPPVSKRTLTYPDAKVHIYSRRRGDIYEINTRTGEFHRVTYDYAYGTYRFACPLARLQSRVFIISEFSFKCTPRTESYSNYNSIRFPSLGLDYTLSEPNVMILDHATYSIDGVVQKEDEFILSIDKELLNHLGAEPRGILSVQPWKLRPTEIGEQLKLKLQFKFECIEMPQAPITLCLENPELFIIKFNDHQINSASHTFWMDPSLRELECPLPNLGKNIITLETEFHATSPSLEAIYIRGMFGVKNETTLTALPRTLLRGDWCTQGLENYAGNVTYHLPLSDKEHAPIGHDTFGGAALGISINDNDEIILPWPPYTLSLKNRLQPKNNIAHITVYGHRRNALGPFYDYTHTFPSWAIHERFAAHQRRYRKLTPCGLL